MTDLTIVIPLGVSIPGTPVLQYLQWCVESLQNQNTTYSYRVIFSCDDNVSDEIKDYLQSTKYEIKWYEPFYYFKKGGLWKKIYDQWIFSDSKYLAFSHYDDMWSFNKIQSQLDLLNTSNVDLCWSRVQIVNNQNNILQEMNSLSELNKNTIFNSPSYAFAHSTITSRKILDSGILEHKDNWSAIYEELYYVYCHRLRGIKDNNSIFYHRVHSDSITNTFNNENLETIIDQRCKTGYSLNETLKDAAEININNIRKKLSEEVV